MKYKDGIEHKFPGYTVDENNLVKNVSEPEIDLNEHIRLLTSKS